MRGIVLAGGTGSRLWPITKGISKQLLPIYDKPLIHYPISTLFLADIKEILIITTPKDQIHFKNLLGDGSQYGVTFEFASQDEPRGLADAFIIGEDFIDGGNVALILGDNLFYGRGLGHQLRTQKEVQGATIFACHVEDPTSYGVISFSPDGRPTAIEEKPSKPRSNFVVPGLYFYDQRVCSIAKEVERSKRGELEITSINQHYLNIGALNVIKLERDIAWLDVGTSDSFISASSFVQTIQQRHGLKMSCLEEIAWRNGWISDAKLSDLAGSYQGNAYGKYLFDLLERGF